MRAEAITHTGLVRQNNEDAVYIAPDRQLFIVADGMGGHVSGEVASAMAVQVVADTIAREGDGEPVQTLRRAFAQANQEIYQAAQEQPDRLGMGTTLTALWVVGDQLYVAHIGDSRAYLIHGDQMTSLTKDHSLVGELFREGGLTAEQAMVHPQRNILTRSLGNQASVEADIADYALNAGDRLFLCTDGLSNLITNPEILAVIRNSSSLHQALATLLALALERGGQDNITLILAENP